MKTSYGRLCFLLIILIAAAYLFMPMRAGQEDSVVLDPAGLRMAVGDSYTLVCRLSSDNMDQKVYFTSSNDHVASIGLDGTVYALSSGKAVITASAAGGAKASTEVTVTGTPLSELSINTSELTLDKGSFSGLSVSYNSDASDARLQWISGDESIATVDQSGRVYGVRGGHTQIYVNAPNGRTASTKVTVNVDSIAANISPSGLTVGVGANVRLKASYLPMDSTDAPRRWSSSDTKIIRMDSDGVLHAVGAGKAYVSVLTEDGITSGMEVIVDPAPADLQLDPARATLDRGETMQMTVQIADKNGEKRVTDHLVVWSSSNPSVASVDRNGLVTALRGGETQIIAVSDGITATCDLTVQIRVHEITLDRTEAYLLKEDTDTPIRLSWTIDPRDADDPEIIFSSNNTQVATVTTGGVVTMTGGYGTAVITASNASGARAEFTVNVVTELPSENSDAQDTDFGETAVTGFGSDESTDRTEASDFGTPAENEIREPESTAAPVQSYEEPSSFGGGFGDGGFGDGGFGDGGAGFAAFDNGNEEAEDFDGESIYD